MQRGQKKRTIADASPQDDSVAINEFEQSEPKRKRKGSSTALDEEVTSLNPATQRIARQLKKGILAVRAGKYIPAYQALIDALTNLSFKRFVSDNSDEDESHLVPPSPTNLHWKRSITNNVQ
jgi:hypothetical protein